MIKLKVNQQTIEESGYDYQKSFKYIYLFITAAHNVVYKSKPTDNQLSHSNKLYIFLGWSGKKTKKT